MPTVTHIIDQNLSAYAVTITGDQVVSGVKTFGNSGIFSLSGVLPLSVPSNPLSIVGSGNTYVQINIQNRSTGTTATSDLVLTANNGTDTSNYINLGINNSGYNDPAFSNGSGLDGYLFINGGNLDIGTQTPDTQIEFHVGGTTLNKTIARINQSGFNLTSGTLKVNNTGVLLSGQNSFLINLYHISDNPTTAGHNYFGILSASTSNAANGSNRRFPVLESCIVKKASWSHFVNTTGTPNLPSTGYLINTTTNITGIISTNINSQSVSTPNNYTVTFSPPFIINEGDNIVCSWFIPTYVTYPASVRNSVNLYCYN